MSRRLNSVVAAGLVAWTTWAAVSAGQEPLGGIAEAPASSVSAPLREVVHGDLASRDRQPLFPGSFKSSTPSPKAADPTPRSGLDSITSTAMPLGMVLAVIVIAAMVFRKAVRSGGSLAASLGAAGRAPAGLLEVLGRYPVSRGQTLVLLKVDQRILLLSQCQPVRGHPGGFTTLCEMADPGEVASILTKVSETESTGPASRFNDMLAEAEGDHAPGTGESLIGARGMGASAIGRFRRAIAAQMGQPVSWVEHASSGSVPVEVPAPTMRLNGVESLRSRLAAARASTGAGNEP